MSIWIQFKELLFQFLVYIQSFVGDWGMAIIVLTVLVRLALTPQTTKQTKAMHEMQRIQPQLKLLQEKYKDEPEKLQAETLELYQSNKVSPLGGCLPMLLQMPLFMALYQVLGGTAQQPGLLMTFLEKNGVVGSLYSLIPNIALTPGAVFTTSGAMAAIPYLILVVTFGLTVWLPQALTPGADKKQKTMGLFMAAMMMFFGWAAPAGVLLYWDLSSIWGVVQQQLTIRSLKRPQAALDAP